MSPIYTFQDILTLARIISSGRLVDKAKIYSEHLLHKTHGFNAAIKSKAPVLMSIPQFQQHYYDNLIQYRYRQQQSLKDRFIHSPITLTEDYINYCLFLLQDVSFQGLHITLLNENFFYIDDHFITIDDQYALSYNVYIRNFFHSILEAKAWAIIIATNTKRHLNQTYFFDNYSQLKDDLNKISVDCLGLIQINKDDYTISV